MLTKCVSCFRALGWKLLGHSVPKWYSHFRSFCVARAQNHPWCNMFLDNLDQIFQQTLSKDVQHLIRNTNIASEIVKIITQHYQDQINLFRFCIELFGSYVKLKFSQTINPSKNTLNRMANQHQEFTKLLIDLFVLYYGLQDRQIVGQQLFYKSTLPALAVHLMFQNQDISATVSRTTKLALKNQIDKIQFQIQRFSNYQIGQFISRQEFRLNEQTLFSFNAPSQRCDDRPYSGAVQIIKQIVRVHSPAEKMRLAEGITKQIQLSITQFYRKHGIKTDMINICSEDFNNIFIYILVQANQPAFLAHLQIASLFSPTAPRENLQNILATCDLLERGSINRKQGSNISTGLSNINVSKVNVSGYFDEVSNFDL